MNIRSFAVTVNRKDAEKEAENKGGLLWRMVFAGLPLSEMRQHFVEYKLITFEATHHPSVFQKVFSKKTEGKKQTITMLANGSTGGVSWVESLPEIITMEQVDENIVQPSDRSDKDLCEKGRRVATRVLHRHVGGIPTLEVKKVESVYRPYWVALYGDVSMGNKVRYKPIAADGAGAHRTR